MFILDFLFEGRVLRTEGIYTLIRRHTVLHLLDVKIVLHMNRLGRNGAPELA